MSGTLGNQQSDATLVTAAVAGDRHAFAGIYDRYADRMHDFCWSMLRSRDDAADAMQDTFVIAAGRLHQLRDPDKLRPWLYAVARSVALRRLRHRRREQADAELDDVADTTDGPHEVAHRAELRALVWEAGRGLSDRDRMVMDLHLRQGLDGSELAQAMGVSENNAYVMVHRVRDRIERSLGAFLVARLGADHCEDLQALLRNWDGRFSPLVRKRVARHVDACAACDERRRAVASPWALLGTIPMLPAPLELRERVLGAAELTSASGGGGSRRGLPVKAAVITVAALVATAGVVAGAEALRARTAPGAPAVAPSASAAAHPTAPAAADLEVSPTVVTLPAGGTATLALHNAGGEQVTWSAASAAAWVTVDGAGGTLAPGASTRITVSVSDPGSVPAATTIEVTHATGAVTVRVRVGAAPGDAAAPDADGEGGDPVRTAPSEDADPDPPRRDPTEPPRAAPSEAAEPEDPRGDPGPEEPGGTGPQDPPGDPGSGPRPPGSRDPGPDPRRPGTGDGAAIRSPRAGIAARRPAPDDAPEG